MIDLHPVLLDLGRLKIYSYGVMMVVAFAAALVFIMRKAKKAGFEPADALDLAIYSFMSGIAGSRVFHILFNLNHFRDKPAEIFNFQAGGLAWHGGLAGGLICIYIYCRVKKYPPGQGMDLMYTATILGLAIGRIGCFLNGCCFGKPCNLPWAVVFPHHRLQVAVHPTQLYEMVMVFALFAFLVYWWDRRRFAGENTLLVFALYSVVRFIVEFFRFNTPDMMKGGLSMAQWISIAGFVVFMGAVIIKRRMISEDMSVDMQVSQARLLLTQEESEEDLDNTPPADEPKREDRSDEPV